MYGITFPDKKQLAEHMERLAEAKKRDHRVVGTQMELFMFDKLSPGSCFFMPNGACIYNSLVEVRSLQRPLQEPLPLLCSDPDTRQLSHLAASACSGV